MFLDPHIGRGPNSAWCNAIRTKRSVVLVCKNWYECAIQILYEDIVFRRRGQIERFLFALSSNTRLRLLVKSVHVASHLIHAYDTHLNCLFRMTPNVTHLIVGMGPVAGLEKRHFRERRSQFPHPQAGLEKVTHLEISDPASVDNFTVKIHLFKSLKFLALSLHNSPEFVPVNFLRQYTHGSLKELQISVMADDNCDNEILKIVADVWRFPALCHLTIIQHGFGTKIMPAYQKLLDLYGHQLESLSITVSRSERAEEGFTLSKRLSTAHIQTLIRRCPQLDHLVIPSVVIKNKPLFHDNLHRVDIWTDKSAPESEVDRLRGLFTTAHFPNLRSVRFVDWALLALSGPRLPVLVPHNIVREGEHLVWRSPGMHIQHDVGHLYQRDMDRIEQYVADCTDYELMDVVSSEHRSEGSDCDSDNADCDCDDSSSNDSTYRAASPAYSAQDSEEGDLEFLETAYDESFTGCLHDRDVVDHVTNNLWEYCIHDEHVTHPPSFVPGYYVDGHPDDAALVDGLHDLEDGFSDQEGGGSEAGDGDEDEET
ncbi:hypothetical protein BDN67DRAFT_28686 [Paxillus ammoniavirescens]|nr:hypothetical protein BDN67DRAFT_28686 [Paxillus ammoniavirescens]